MVHRRGEWVSIDAWRGYWKPSNAIVGQSIFGEKFDREEQDKDLAKMKTILKRLKIPFRVKTSKSSNVFMAKRWIIIPTKINLTKLQEDTIKNYARENTATFND
jgi:hypothetical protein